MFNIGRSLRLAVILIVGITASVGARAQDVMQFSLEEAIQYALSNNYELKSTRFEEYKARAQANEILSAGYPQINAKGDMTYYVKIPTSLIPAAAFGGTAEDPPIEVQFGQPWNITGGFEASQLIFDGTFFIGIKGSRVFVELSELETNRSEEDAALTVSKAYLQVLITQENLKLLDANIERLQKLYAETTALNEAGFAEKIDVDRLKINLTNLELERANGARLAQTSLDLLKFQMGIDIHQAVLLTESLEDYAAIPDNLVEVPYVDPTTRIEYSVLETNRKLQLINKKRFQAGYWPTIYGFGAYQWNAQRNEFNFFDGKQPWFPVGTVGLNVSIPIFDGFRKKSQVDQVRYTLNQIDTQMEMLEQSIQLEVKNTHANMIVAYNNLQSLKRNRDLAQEVFDVADTKYKEGVGSSLELNDAESALKEADTNYLRAQFEYLLSRLELSKARGEFARYHR
ncbi:TolC family protein [Pontibacter sp. G13]|uniref:TolC family protein n=1 Tax=Pontibacter sp. G13 TaxID=3074898 RepID=UPI0028897513|nr:TolC family protein [Pontibacter sp. G13]WNJ19179.1 TolC family protein [Pontibacter sp. G13]